MGAVPRRQNLTAPSRSWHADPVPYSISNAIMQTGSITYSASSPLII